MPQATAWPISGRPHVHWAVRDSRRSFAARYRWVDDYLHQRADGLRLLDSPLLRLPDVKRLACRRFRRSTVANVHAARALLR